MSVRRPLGHFSGVLLSTLQATHCFAAMSIAGFSLSYCSGFLFARSNYGNYAVYSLNLLAPFAPFAESTLGE